MSIWQTGKVQPNALRTASGGTLVVDNFGFEYVETVEGQQITKRQVGAKPWIVQCSRT